MNIDINYNEIYLKRAIKEQRKIYGKIAGWVLIPIGFAGAVGLIGKLISMPLENTRIERIAPVLTAGITGSAIVMSGAITNYKVTLYQFLQEARENSQRIRYFRDELEMDKSTRHKPNENNLADSSDLKGLDE